MNGVLGADQLLAVFGYWPSFHDAEVLSLQLDRRALGDGYYGPTLEVLVHAFEITRAVGADGCYVTRHRVLVHLRFLDVVELELGGFNHQNALLGLTLTDTLGRQMEQVKWAVRFDPASGMGASFQCAAVAVVSVVPCDRTGNRIPAGPGTAAAGKAWEDVKGDATRN